MKTLTRLLLCAALLGAALSARAERIFNQAELDALLAPIALYPDTVLSHVLVAARYPDDVREAAAWSRNNPQLRGDDALYAVEPEVWHPSVKALAAFPDVIARLADNPSWLRDLGEAYRGQGPLVMDTVQALRRRARETGYLTSDNQQQVYDDRGAIAIAPASPQVVYVPYYDPYVVYGDWWWPAYRPIVWAPWPVYGVYVSVSYVRTYYPHWQRRVVVVERRATVNHHVHHRPAAAHKPAAHQKPPVAHRPPVVQRPPIVHAQFRSEPPPPRDKGRPSPARQEQQKAAREREKERAPQQGSQREHRSRDSHPPRQSSQPKSSQPKRNFDSSEPGRGNEHRGSRGRRD